MYDDNLFNCDKAEKCLTSLWADVLCFQFADWIESNYLTEQTEAIKQLSDYITNLKRVGPGLGEYMFDKETLSS